MTRPEAVLMSGGMDSIALAFWWRPALAITIDYGQRPARGEIQASIAACDDMAIEHCVIRADCSATESGDLAGVPALPIAPVPEWWPFRNQLIITLAAIECVRRRIPGMLIGTVKTDGAHCDGTPRFIDAILVLLAAQEGALTLETPAIGLGAALSRRAPRERFRSFDELELRSARWQRVGDGAIGIA